MRDIYTIRPDGSDVRRLTTDGLSTSRDLDGGRTDPVHPRLERAGSGGAPGWWTMDADGTERRDASCRPTAIGVAADELPMDAPGLAAARRSGHRAPAVDARSGGRGRAAGADAVPDARPRTWRPGSAWTGSPTTNEDGPLGEYGHAARRRARPRRRGLQHGRRAVRPGDRHVQRRPARMTASRGGTTATLLPDGRVLFTGGYNCGRPARTGSGRRPSSTTRRPARSARPGRWRAPREFSTRRRCWPTVGCSIAGGLSGLEPAGGRRRHARLVSDRRDRRQFLATAELYDPTTGTFSKTGSMSTPRRRPHRDPAPGRPVLVVGGGGESSASRDVGRRLRPGDRQVQPDRLAEDRPLAPHRDAARGRPGARSSVAGRRRIPSTCQRRAVRPAVRQVQRPPVRWATVDSSTPRPSSPMAGLHRRRLLERRPEVAGPVRRPRCTTQRPGDFSPIGSMGAPRERPHRDAPERRPGPHRRRRGHREQWRRRGRLGGALPAVVDQATTRRRPRQGGRRRNSGPARG